MRENSSACPSGLDRSTLVVLTSDHGEDFGEHGSFEHGHTLFDEVLRMPLIIGYPAFNGERRRQAVSLPLDRRHPYHDTICMKRTSLTLDEHLLEDALRLGGERTYSKTVERALELFVRRIKARQILELGHSGLWNGDLGEMRRDAPAGDQRPL